MPHRRCDERVAERWTIRIVPFFIFGAFAYAKYAVVAHICVDYLYRQKQQHGTAVALTVLYFVFFLTTLATYLRTFVTAQRNPGLVPFNDRRQAAEDRRRALPKRERDDVEAQNQWSTADQDPDSPGLEAFYTKDVFVCEADGRPRWCALCWNWKPDRAHHSSQLNRCVRKMDHLCPWVGGMVSETSFNFFFQFTLHCSLFLAVCLGASAYALSLQQRDGLALDGRVISIIVLASMFGLFAFGMTLTSGKYIFENITSIDMLQKRPQYYLAVRVPLDTPSNASYWTITYPLARPNEMINGFDGHIATTRDGRARRTFAILRTDLGDNPWDLGPWANFKSVMGNTPLEWLLPIRHSPCCDHDGVEGSYQFGPVVKKLRERYNLPSYAPQTDGVGGIELREKKTGRH